MEYIVAVLCMCADWEREPWLPQGSYAHCISQGCGLGSWTASKCCCDSSHMHWVTVAEQGCPQGGMSGCAEWLLCAVSQYLCVPYVKIIFHPPR